MRRGRAVVKIFFSRKTHDLIAANKSLSRRPHREIVRKVLQYAVLLEPVLQTIDRIERPVI